MSSDGRIVGYAFAGLIAGGIWFFNAFTVFRQKKLIENTPTSKVRSIAMGNVEAYGKVIPNKNDMVISPFSKKPCAYCRWTIEEYRREGKHSKWVTLKAGSEGKFFYLQDDTGLVLVNPDKANVDIPMDFETQRVSEDIKLFCKSNAIDVSTFLGFNKTMRFREYYLMKGDKVYIMGYAGDNPFVDEGSSQKNEADIMIQKGPRNQFYYISDKSEKEVLKSFGFKVAGGFFGGGALILFCLFVIFAYFGIL